MYSLNKFVGTQSAPYSLIPNIKLFYAVSFPHFQVHVGNFLCINPFFKLIILQIYVSIFMNKILKQQNQNN